MNTMIYTSPLGEVLLSEEHGYLTGLWFIGQAHFPAWILTSKHTNTPLIMHTCAWLDQYFAGSKNPYPYPYQLEGTPFQKDAYAILETIPYGETITYGEIAKRLGKPKAYQAVGQAVGKNPISIIVPCHRVIGANGKLSGYAGGIARKDFLLELEKKHRND